ncbi:hypothetical protein OUY22_18120 [Nonomuraea sp. MCN248]|uniref:Uncharacterized protein n=1 Tax=Nonomuraea corallina TaxID=2989783 RepID=A0ABT4SDT8_9ACTN|nr:hypothetical protein [Nonomuraea corallina]MDA0635342.1 hypothetical protein [Nonomuraea corallina]
MLDEQIERTQKEVRRAFSHPASDDPFAALMGALDTLNRHLTNLIDLTSNEQRRAKGTRKVLLRNLHAQTENAFWASVDLREWRAYGQAPLTVDDWIRFRPNVSEREKKLFKELTDLLDCLAEMRTDASATGAQEPRKVEVRIILPEPITEMRDKTA